MEIVDVSSVWSTGLMCPRIAMNVAQCKQPQYIYREGLVKTRAGSVVADQSL